MCILTGLEWAPSSTWKAADFFRNSRPSLRGPLRWAIGFSPLIRETNEEPNEGEEI
jgi:hypothetical protein